MPGFIPPPGYGRIRVVTSFEALTSARFGDGVNAICWPRELAGDFAEVVRLLMVGDGVTSIEEPDLRALRVSARGKVAVKTLLGDLEMLRGIGMAPSLDVVRDYPRDAPGRVVPTDVHSFHADSAPVATDTYLCSYTPPATECLRNDEARRHVDNPETRARLLAEFGGDDGPEFLAHLGEHAIDRHYEPAVNARPFSFGVGNLWRISVEYPGAPVPPCLHRAPEHAREQAPRLLLIC